MWEKQPIVMHLWVLFLFSFLIFFGPLNAEAGINDYAKEIQILETEKDLKELRLIMLVLKGKISYENFERKQSKGKKNQSHFKILEALKKHISSPDEQLRLNTLELQQEIIQDEPPGMANECNRIDKLTTDQKPISNISELIRFYSDYCIKDGSAENIAFFKYIVTNRDLQLFEKITLATRLKTEDERVVDFLIDTAKQNIDSNDHNRVFHITQSLCKGSGRKIAVRIRPLLKESYYQDFAMQCLSVMKPDIWPEIAPLMESGKYPEVRQAVKIFNQLRPMAALPTISKRLKETKNDLEIEILRLLRVKITHLPDEELERILLSRKDAENLEPRTLFLNNTWLVDYYVEIGSEQKVDQYLMPFLQKRRKPLYWEICRKYADLGKPSKDALQLLKQIKAEEGAKEFPTQCDSLLNVKTGS